MYNRNCAEAFEYYAKALDGKITEIQRYSDSPPDPAFPVAEEDRNLVLHATLKIGEIEIMGADSSEHCESGNNMYVTLTAMDKNYVQKAWDMLKQDGHVYMEITPQFFAVLHGSLRDKFGVNWMFTVPK
jgi:PhnB protein